MKLEAVLQIYAALQAAVDTPVKEIPEPLWKRCHSALHVLGVEMHRAGVDIPLEREKEPA